MHKLNIKHQNNAVKNHKCQKSPLSNSPKSKNPDVSIIRIANTTYGSRRCIDFFFTNCIICNLPTGRLYKYPAMNINNDTAIPTQYELVCIMAGNSGILAFVSLPFSIPATWKNITPNNANVRSASIYTRFLLPIYVMLAYLQK